MTDENEMANPYSPTDISHDAPAPSIVATILQRFAAIFLYLAGWVCVGVIASGVLTQISGELPSPSIREAELTTFQSFSRFCVHYWFTAFVFLSPPACLVTWLLLRRNGIRKTRWALLGLSLAISPFLLVIAWLVFRPVLFR